MSDGMMISLSEANSALNFGSLLPLLNSSSCCLSAASVLLVAGCGGVGRPSSEIPLGSCIADDSVSPNISERDI